MFQVQSPGLTACALRSVQEEKAQALARLNAEKDKFFSIISHDLRSPFNIVLGNAKFLLKSVDTASPAEIKDIAQSIHQGARAVYNLLENLLTWSRLQREGGLMYHPEPIELIEVARTVQTVIGPVAAQKEIALSNTVEPGLWVYADRNMLETVIRNLASSALTFTPRGGQVTLSAQAGSAYRLPGFVTIAVQDTGVGMTEAVMANLFRIDTQHSSVGTGNEPGTGLGLIVCQEMVQRNGGKIWVTSEVSKGTTMQFTAPYTTPLPT